MFAEEMLKRKKAIVFAVIGFTIFSLIIVGIIIFLTKEKVLGPPVIQENTEEEILQSLTAPTSTEGIETPEEVIESIKAPQGQNPVEIPQEVIDGLTAPSK